jgi:membrane-associated protease RseP (regulator of RpoE activity)
MSQLRQQDSKAASEEMTILSSIIQFKWIILFYLGIILLFFIKRKNVAIQAKIVFLYRTVFGIRFINKLATRFREWIKLFGYVGVGVGFLGLIVISVLMVTSFLQLFTRPEQPSGVSLVLPGVNVPGLGILPFWHWLIAIFLIAAIHELGHGIVARAHNLKINWTGIVLIGPIVGAFVEPDEKKLVKQTDVIQYSVYAAGAVANIFLGLVAVFLMTVVAVPLQQSLVEPVGFTFDNYYQENFPAERAGLLPGEVITSINGQETKTFNEFAQVMIHSRPNETVMITTREKSLKLTAATHPEDQYSAFIGIVDIRNENILKNENYNLINQLLLTLIIFLRWLFVLSLGIGLFNLLPLPIVDGGRMTQTFLKRLWGEQRGNNAYGKIGIFFLLLLILSLLIPFFRWIISILN